MKEIDDKLLHKFSISISTISINNQDRDMINDIQPSKPMEHIEIYRYFGSFDFA